LAPQKNPVAVESYCDHVSFGVQTVRCEPYVDKRALPTIFRPIAKHTARYPAVHCERVPVRIRPRLANPIHNTNADAVYRVLDGITTTGCLFGLNPITGQASKVVPAR